MPGATRLAAAGPPAERLDAETLTVDTLRTAVGQVTSSTKVRGNLDRMRMAAHNGGGASGAAAAIEEYLSKT
ncbi:MAG: hypothetical protein ACRDSF_22530 [Pseudonocardiaceae bacterium]